MKTTKQMAAVMVARLMTQQIAINQPKTTNTVSGHADGSIITNQNIIAVAIPKRESRAVELNKMLFNNVWETYVDIIGP